MPFFQQLACVALMRMTVLYISPELSKIFMLYIKALHLAGINSFKKMEEADSRRIEIITGRKYPFGNHIKDTLLSLPPKIVMKIEEAECRRPGKSKIVITLTRLSQSVSSLKRHYADMVCIRQYLTPGLCLHSNTFTSKLCMFLCYSL